MERTSKVNSFERPRLRLEDVCLHRRIVGDDGIGFGLRARFKDGVMQTAES